MRLHVEIKELPYVLRHPNEPTKLLPRVRSARRGALCEVKFQILSTKILSINRLLKSIKREDKKYSRSKNAKKTKISQEDFHSERKIAVRTDTVDTAILHFKHLTELLKMTFNTL